MPDDAPLSPRQLRFVEEYPLDLNGTAAAIRAGYARSGADVQAVRLLANDRIKKEIAARLATQSERAEVTKDYLITTLQGVYAKAIKEGHYNGSARLGELLAKLNGHIIEKRETREVKNWGDLSDTEVANLAAEEVREGEETRH